MVELKYDSDATKFNDINFETSGKLGGIQLHFESYHMELLIGV